MRSLYYVESGLEKQIWAIHFSSFDYILQTVFKTDFAETLLTQGRLKYEFVHVRHVKFKFRKFHRN